MWEPIKDFFSYDSSGNEMEVLVVGDVMLDTYIRGTVDRVSPEAPVQVLEWKDEKNVPGGAANVACNLSALGCKTHLLGTAGCDPEGERLKSILEDNGVITDGLILCQNSPTTHKIRVLAHNQQVLRIDREEKHPLPEKAFDEIIQHLTKHAPLIKGIICSDYAKGVLTPALMRRLIEIAREHDLPVVADPKGSNYSKYSGCHSITPNEKELARATGLSVNCEADVERASRELLKTIGCRSVMVTRGERGISLVMQDGETEHIAAESREVYDVTGAGDTVVSVFGMALFGGLPMPLAAMAANAAGGLAVGKLGTAIVTREEILHHFRNRELTAGSKLVEFKHLKEALKKERHLGRKIVFTNGCFDPIHKGHISLLEQAARLGDILIVGLNSDDSVSRLKGPDRPSVTQEDRAYILGALESVHYVTIFHEDTPEKLIKQIKPDYLVKGADYRPEDIVGKEFVESYGGKVELIPLVPDKSSTRYLASVAAKNKR